MLAMQVGELDFNPHAPGEAALRLALHFPLACRALGVLRSDPTTNHSGALLLG